MDWDAPRWGKSNWRNIVAVVVTEPEWGPIHRAENPTEWFWYVPGVDNLQTVKELLAVANLQRAGEKGKLSAFRPAPRPWDKNTRKIAAAQQTYKEAREDFMSRFE